MRLTGEIRIFNLDRLSHDPNNFHKLVLISGMCDIVYRVLFTKGACVLNIDKMKSLM